MRKALSLHYTTQIAGEILEKKAIHLLQATLFSDSHIHICPLYVETLCNYSRLAG